YPRRIARSSTRSAQIPDATALAAPARRPNPRFVISWGATRPTTTGPSASTPTSTPRRTSRLSVARLIGVATKIAVAFAPIRNAATVPRTASGRVAAYATGYATVSTPRERTAGASRSDPVGPAGSVAIDVSRPVDPSSVTIDTSA